MDNNFTSYFTNPKYVTNYNFNGKGMIYIENERDYVFWESIFNAHFDGMYEIKSSIKNDGRRGKDALLELIPTLNKNCLLAIDGDFDYISECDYRFGKFMSNAYVLHTHSYSRESAVFSKSKIDEVVSKLRLTLPCTFDVNKPIQIISKIYFKALVGFLYLMRKNRDLAINIDIHKPIKKCEFRKYINNDFTSNDKIIQEMTSLLEPIENEIYSYIDERSIEFSSFVEQANRKGLKEDSAYRFISGHVLNDNILLPMLARIKFLMERQSFRSIASEDTSKENKSNMISAIKNHYRDNCKVKTIITHLNLCANDEISKMINSKVSAIH
ncbi:hypothetical protein RCR42_27015 (plasmid) [Enterobacter hormaechei]|uniref:hypothetical protein n=1 Tax=Enterobacter hormaechei TaxID=158836 RepID=UPI00281242CD|nr:hypothetical protein [Enterobacter hormaechei]WMQ89916.1 hypothetical protein RCR42_27015 [Enterobacter hormaechei]